MQVIPPALMVAVTGPGRVLVSRGQRTLAGLAGGTLANVATDVFSAPWLASLFGELQTTQWAEDSSRTGRGAAPAPRGLLERGFGQKLDEHVLRRIVATIRAARHGGTLVILPPEARQPCRETRCLTLKYPFFDDEPRRRILTLTVEIVNELAKVSSPSPTQAAVGWAAWVAIAMRAPVVAAYAGPDASPRRVSSSTCTSTGLTR